MLTPEQWIEEVGLHIARLPAFSIKQPYSWLIVHGHKDIENRDWQAGFRGEVLIHAGLKHYGKPDEWDWPEITPPRGFLYGGIVGVAEIVGCVSSSRSEWFVGKYGLVIRNATPLPFLPCKGQLSFFKPDVLEPARRRRMA